MLHAGVVLGISLSLGCEDVVVALVEVARVEVVPAVATVEVGQATDLTAEAQDADGNALGGHPIAWESGDEAVATVTASGRVTGVSAGETTIRAVSDGRSGEAALTVLRPPRIVLNRASVVLQTLEGSDSPPRIDVAVTNGGDSPLEGLAVTVEYEGTADGWLETSLSGTAAPATLTIATDPAGLGAGQFLATVVVAADRADNTPLSLPIELDVQAAAAAPPSELTATVASATSVTLAWTDNSDDETEFRIERRDPGASSFAQLATAGANLTGYTDTTVAADGVYVFRVRACGPGGCSAFSNVAQATTPPNAISGLAASVVSASEIRLTWTDASTTETSAEVQRASGGGSFSTVATLGADATGHSDTGLTPGVSYTYRARACNAGGCGPFSNQDSATTPTLPVPAAPTGLTATYDSATAAIDLTWTDNSTDETEFRVERKNPSANTFVLLAAGLAPDAVAYSDTTVNLDGTYVYRVTACAAGGCSAYTAEASATTPPLAPDALTASGLSPTQIQLSWSDNSATETVFQIERDNRAGAGFVRISQLPGGTTSAIDASGLAANTTYDYRVRACNGSGCTAYTNVATATTSAIPPPTAPSGLVATTAAGGGAIDLVWADNASTETRVEVERDAGTGFALLTTLNVADATAHSDATVASDHRYAYRVRACNAGGCSAFSNSATAFTPPVAPTGLAGSAASSTQIDLTWTDASTTETSQEVEQSTGGGFTQVASVGANATGHSVTGLTVGTAYTYRVRACNTGGCGPYSATANVSTQTIAAPTSLVATTASAGTSIDLTWTDNAGDETRYEVQRNAGSGFTNLVNLGADATSHSDGTVSADNSYTYRVRACNAGGCSAFSNTSSASTPPNAPSALAASTITISAVTLGWTDNSTTETQFVVQRRSSPGAFTQVGTAAANATGFSDNTVQPDSTYTYRVQACNSGGCSASSNTVQAVMPPAAPSGLAATTAGSGMSINLAWTDNASSETGYEVQRNAGSGFTALTSLGVNAVSYPDAAVAADRVYAYRVRACNGTGCSAFSNTATDTTTPAAPATLTATPVSSVQIDLSWPDLNNTETRYEVEQDGGSGFVARASLPANSTSYPATGLTVSTGYGFRVRACNTSGCGPFVTTSATTPAIPAPNGLTATTTSGTSIGLAWTDQAMDETSYEVERGTAAGTNFANIATIPSADVVSHTDATGSLDATYSYRVRACNAGGCSAYSPTDTASTAPNTPTGASARIGNPTTISVAWTDNSSNETRYAIERDVDGTGFVALPDLGVNSSGYQDIGLISGTYTYRVRACTGSVCSTAASTGTVTVP